MILLWLCAFLPMLYWESGPEASESLRQAGWVEIAVPPAQRTLWKRRPGFSITTVDVGKLRTVPPASIRANGLDAGATRSPWIDFNGWKFLRVPNGRFFTVATGKTAALAAAEAFVFGAEIYVQTDGQGLLPMAEMLSFLRKLNGPSLPRRANIGFLDDGSQEAGEIMNLMLRRNLLFRIVSHPDPRLGLNVKPGSADYPVAKGFDPSEMAQKIRSELTDAKRLIRVYGSDVVIAQVNGDAKQLRIHLLNYAGMARDVNGVRIRVLGHFLRHKASLFGDPGAELLDYLTDESATEFTLAKLGIYGVIDLFSDQ